MSKYKVETSDLKASATIMEEKNSSYTSAYGKLYAETAGLKVDWQGQSSDVFNAKVDSYRKSFDELSSVIARYTEFLRNAAASYEATEQALTEAASKLAGN